MTVDGGFNWQGRHEGDVRPACHPDAPAWARMNRSAQLTLICAVCGAPILKVTASRAVFEEVEFR